MNIEKKVKINDLAQEFGVGRYHVIYYENNTPTSSGIFEMESVDNHYILKQYFRSEDDMRGIPNSFGVAHETKEADKRLYDSAKEFAEELVSHYDVKSEIEEDTRHVKTEGKKVIHNEENIPAIRLD